MDYYRVQVVGMTRESKKDENNVNLLLTCGVIYITTNDIETFATMIQFDPIRAIT